MQAKLSDIPSTRLHNPHDHYYMYALFSLHDDDKPGSEVFAKYLVDRGYKIISSGGTARYLTERNVPVIDISTITGYMAVLRHRVVTLAPQIHGGLLATPEMYPELDELGWKKIHLLYVTFYPLKKELDRPEATIESCIEKTDIGGPTMIRSANKGGEVIVMTDSQDVQSVTIWFEGGMINREEFLYCLRAKAELRVAEYCSLSAQVYKRFANRSNYKYQ